MSKILIPDVYVESKPFTAEVAQKIIKNHLENMVGQPKTKELINELKDVIEYVFKRCIHEQIILPSNSNCGVFILSDEYIPQKIHVEILTNEYDNEEGYHHKAKMIEKTSQYNVEHIFYFEHL